MSTYYPMYLEEETGSKNNLAYSGSSAESEITDHSKRHQRSHRSHSSKRYSKSKSHPRISHSSRTAAAFHVEDEKLSSSEEIYSSKRKAAEKNRKETSRYDKKTHSAPEAADSHRDQLDNEYPNNFDLYCQKTSSSNSSSSWEDGTSFTYIAGTMYPPPSSEDVSGGVNQCLSYRNVCFPTRVFQSPFCRPRFLKFLLLVVVILLMGQFSLNTLIYRNYDPIFYINVSAAESLSSFESRVRWVSNKLPWIQSKTEKAITVTPLHNTTLRSLSSSPLLIGGKKVKDGSSPKRKGKTKLLEKLEADKERKEKMNNQIPNKIPDEGGGEVSKNDNVSKHVSGSNKSTKDAPPSTVPADSNKSKSKDRSLHDTSKSSSTVNIYQNASSSGKNLETTRVLLSKEKSLCPPVPPKLKGIVKITRTVPNLEEQERSHPELEPGGRFRPAECRARHRVAIIVPYRDRVKHLTMFIYHIHPMLQRQQIDYAIYIVEQAGSGKFNRAMLMNVGALEALKQYQYDCFVFHDVDLLPEDDRNLYTCPEQPRHMSIAIDTMQYKLPYNDIFGGVSAMTADQFRTVNGFSNKFWGWGGEDDDMSNRIKFHGFFISRYPANIGRYTMLSHRKDEPNPRRYQYLYDGKQRFKSDGLNSAKYRTLDLQLRRLYTWVYIDLYPS